jgi:GT2 family glycosyltransferase
MAVPFDEHAGRAPSQRGIAVVVVSFNTRDHLRACLESVMPQGARRVVVADNGSTDGSVTMVHDEFPGAELDIDEANPGYGAAANRGIRRCGHADVLLLNSDTRLARGSLDALRAYLDDHTRAGIVGPRLRNPDGSLQRSTFPFPAPFRPPLLNDPLARAIEHVPFVRERYLATWSHTRPRVVPYVVGAALAIRRAAFDAVGGFDESYFMYAEEVDLCWRMRAAGWETHFAPVTDVVHVGRASTMQQRPAMLERSVLSSVRFYQRHYSGGQLRRAVTVMRSALALRLLRDRARHALTSDVVRKGRLAEDIEVWRRTLRSTAQE